MLQSERSRDINLGVGVSDKECELEYFQVPKDVALSTFSQVQAALHKQNGYDVITMKIRVVPLTSILEEHLGDRTIDFLKIDVEGLEEQVIKGLT